MITAIVRFPLISGTTLAEASALFESTAPRYAAIPGLVRKYYLYQEDEGSAGGVYLWNSREEAERLYTDEWKQVIADKYGTIPDITYFASPVIVETELASNLVADAAE